LVRIASFNQSRGYGLFVRQGSITCTMQVGSTDDGGAAFISLTTVASSPCSQGYLVSNLAFDDHGDGFAYGSELFVTHDSGSSWAQMPEPGPVLSVEALGSSIWMAVSGCPLTAGQVGQCPVRLLQSNDGGRTWRTANVPSGAEISVDSDGGGQTWLLRVSTNVAYLATVPALSAGASMRAAPLWYTADGGLTWDARSVPCGLGVWSVALSSAPDGTLFAVCASEPSAGIQLKSVLRSSDDGQTWTTMLACGNTATGPPSCADNPLSAGYVDEIDAVSNSTVFLVGDRSSLMVSHNAGASWAPIQPLIGDDSGGTSQVTFFDQTDGVVVGNGSDEALTIWTTTDGGTTWTSVVPNA
jgi:photosystem II stability/assembly factor-like uncharacterized protein